MLIFETKKEYVYAYRMSKVSLSYRTRRPSNDPFLELSLAVEVPALNVELEDPAGVCIAPMRFRQSARPSYHAMSSLQGNTVHSARVMLRDDGGRG